MDWHKHQQKVAKQFGGIVNAKSKGADVIQGSKYIIECKLREKSFNLTPHIWEKIYWQAMRAGKEPLIAVKIGDYELGIVELSSLEEE